MVSRDILQRNLVSEGGCLHQDKIEGEIEAAGSRAGNKKKIFSSRVMVPGESGVIKWAVSSFKNKCIQKAQRGYGGKRLGWHRDGNQPVEGQMHPTRPLSYIGHWR